MGKSRPEKLRPGNYGATRYFGHKPSTNSSNIESRSGAASSKPSKPNVHIKTFDGATDFVPFDAEEDVAAKVGTGTNRGSRSEGKTASTVQSVSSAPAIEDAEGNPLRGRDPFPGDAPVDKKLLEKYDRGKGFDGKGVNTHFHKDLMKKREEKIYFSKQQAARTHILQTETAGFLETDDPLEDTVRLTQKELASTVDLQSQAKHFDLSLPDFAPYSFQYTRNGRFLMLTGQQGHVATMDWVTKKLQCEFHVQERVNCGQWLHQETMFAVAQKNWLHMYDNRGIEVHCIKKLFGVKSMDFLPYHFLLATGNDRGFVSWLDISVGQMVANYPTKSGPLRLLKHNPSNAVVHLGHANGQVSLWSPNLASPLVKFLSHHNAVRALNISPNGTYMATAGCDRQVKVWDLRKYEVVQEIDLYQAPVSLGWSQTGLLAVGMERSVEVFKDVGIESQAKMYMRHFVKGGMEKVAFCPFEDILGIGHSEGFSSLLIPGSGEAHMDALETNPFQTKRQRQEMEVHSLLEKVPSELIGLDAGQIGKVHEPSLQEQLEEKSRVLHARIPKVEFTPKYKALGGSLGWTKRKKTVKGEKKRQQIKDAVKERQKLLKMAVEGEDEGEEVVEKSMKAESVFDRFKKKNV